VFIEIFLFQYMKHEVIAVNPFSLDPMWLYHWSR